MTKNVAAIDGNSLMHRAFHAIPPTMNAPDGTPTNAVFGFLSMLLKFIDEAHPDALICAFDAGRPAFRMDALAQYKAQRPPMDPDLKAQFPVIETLLEAMNIPVVRLDGWEGDDVLGSVAARCEELGFHTLLVSGDKDIYQLVSDHTQVVTTKRGLTDIAIYGPAQVFERYGVTPEQFPDFLGLMGDSSDNIPGVAGIGEKTAAKLLGQYGSIEGIYDHLDELRGKQHERLVEGRELASISRKVATIVRDLPIDCDFEALSFPSFDRDVVTEAFSTYRLHAPLTRVLALVGEKPARVQASLSWKPLVMGDAAQSVVEAACASEDYVGVAFVEPSQTSLFEQDVLCAISTEKGTAVLRGEEGCLAFARIAGQGRFACLDTKTDLHRIYPPDTQLPALIDENQLFNLRSFDLGLAAYVLNSSQADYSIDGLLQEYADGGLPEAQNDDERAAMRAAAVRSLVKPLQDALKQDKSWLVYAEIDLPLVPVLVAMERTGAALDADRLAAMGVQVRAELDELRQRIYAQAGQEFNVDSPQQLAHILFEVLDLPHKKKTQRGYSTAASVLKELSDLHPLPGLVLHYRELAKITSTYIEALPILRGGDGRIHTSFNETVTATGRLSSSNPNLQNIPVRTDFGRHIRECFTPLEPDELFVSADYSQIELRLLAHLSGDEHLIDAFCSGADFHANTASRVFDLPLDEVSPQLRRRAKAVNFGIVYGQQAFGLAQSLGVSFAEAKEMIDRYFEAYPGVRRYLDEVVERARECGYAETMFGRKRRIPELRAKGASQRGFGERTAMNHPMQGSAADIIKRAMCEVERRLRAGGFQTKLLLQVHDELDFSVPRAELEAVRDLVTDAMEQVVTLRVPLVVDVGAGETWADAH